MPSIADKTHQPKTIIVLMPQVCRRSFYCCQSWLSFKIIIRHSKIIICRSVLPSCHYSQGTKQPTQKLVASQESDLHNNPTRPCSCQSLQTSVACNKIWMPEGLCCKISRNWMLEWLCPVSFTCNSKIVWLGLLIVVIYASTDRPLIGLLLFNV